MSDEEMNVVLSIMWTNPKEPERNKKRFTHQNSVSEPYAEKKTKEGVKWKRASWADGSGLMLAWYEFESLEDFNKVWGDDEFQSNLSRWSFFVDNCKIKIWRPSANVRL